MTIQEAITKAVEGGWSIPKSDRNTVEEAIAFHSVQFEFLLDPLFWQALGKAMGWGKCSCGVNRHLHKKRCKFREWMKY